MVNEKTNKDYCRTYHQKKGDLYKANDTTRKKNWNWKKKRRKKCFKKKVAARVSECLKKDIRAITGQQRQPQKLHQRLQHFQQNIS